MMLDHLAHNSPVMPVRFAMNAEEAQPAITCNP
jgi:hypothetical protein